MISRGYCKQGEEPVKKAIIIVGIILMMLSASGCAHELTWGNPETLAEVDKKAQEYLDQTFSQKMIVIGSYKYIGSSYYNIKAFPENNEEFTFYVKVNEDFTDWSTDYSKSLFEYELCKDINKQVKELYNPESKAHVSINTGVMTKEKMPFLTENTTLKEVEDAVNYNYTLDIFSHGEEEYSDIDKQANKIIEILSFIKQHNLKPEEVSFVYFPASGEIALSVYFNPEEYQTITDIEFIKQMIEENIRKRQGDGRVLQNDIN